MPKSSITIGVLAGGSGTRFWPAGRVTFPKQLLPLDGDDPRPLLEVTWERLLPLSATPPRLIAPLALARPFRKALPADAAEAGLFEPRPRNTAPAVALIAYAALHDAPKDPVLVVPADHHVRPVSAYRRALKAMAARARRSEAIVTLGLAPTHPATGYGYLRLGEVTETKGKATFHRVDRYVEKPALPKARRMTRDGKHLWNGGTFAFMPEVFVRELRAHLPEVAEPMEAAFERYGKRTFKAALGRAYDAMPSVSVDYGVMEQADQVETLVASLTWDDLGSWDAIARHRKPDADGNSARGDATLVDSTNCVVDAREGHVALLGVEDLIVVRTGDTVLVAKRGRGEDVRAIVDRLKADARGELLE